jgi:hypothetical protein
MTKILFIGNSYTFFNDMPKIFERICIEHGKDVRADSITCGGYTLSHFVSEENEYGVNMRKMLSECGYTYAVMQEQSIRPANQPETFISSAKKLTGIVRSYGAEPVFYETWARADGSDTLEKFSWTRDEMQSLLRQAYERAAEETGAKLVYAGERVSEAYKNGEAVICDDKSHPTPLGSEIIAEEFYRALEDIL